MTQGGNIMARNVWHQYLKFEQCIDAAFTGWFHRLLFYLLLILIVGMIVHHYAPLLERLFGEYSICHRNRCIV